LYQIDNGSCFSGTRRTVEEQVWKIAFLNDILEEFTVERIKNDMVELGWSIFLDPGDLIISYGHFIESLKLHNLSDLRKKIFKKDINNRGQRL
jgi:hypothetical protein